MKLNKLLMTCAMVAALCLSADTLLAQAGGGFGGGGNGGGGNGFGGGGQGGQGGGGGRRGGQGGANFDPAAFQQQQMDRYRTLLEVTNDVDWAVIQPLVQKVVEARTALGNGRGGGRRGGGGFGGGGQTVNVEQQALQDAIDNNAPAPQIKNALDKYQASQKAKQATLTAAQEALRQVLSGRQEAIATLNGLLP